jgi:hypothetical protein
MRYARTCLLILFALAPVFAARAKPDEIALGRRWRGVLQSLGAATD